MTIGGLCLVVGIAMGIYFAEKGVPFSAGVFAAGGEEPGRTRQMEPNGILSDPYMYYPGTEPLDPDGKLVRVNLAPLRDIPDAVDRLVPVLHGKNHALDRPACSCTPCHLSSPTSGLVLSE